MDNSDALNDNSDLNPIGSMLLVNENNMEVENVDESPKQETSNIQMVNFYNNYLIMLICM